MQKSELHDALEKIQTTDSVKDRIFWDVQRLARDKKALSGKKLHFFRMQADRFVPLAAVCVILLGVFSYFGVTTGFLTGIPVAPQDITGGGATTYKVTEPAETGATQASTAEKATDAPSGPAQGVPIAQNSPTADDIVVYASIDIGFTTFTISKMPIDAAALWQEMQRIGAAPTDVTLTSYTLIENSLTLNFGPELQALLDRAAASHMITGFSKSYHALFPDVTELFIYSGDAALHFQGEPINCMARWEEEVVVTELKTLVYGGELN